ncbi:hypothetical protein [Amycolatopsis speibonae]|uniref:Uncharacterized protein n=1 Tax=Amycolatopsis speibonae TaxID=1450224 RepID=A0ABV7P4P9_9PSEU
MSDLSPRQWGKGDPEPPADVKMIDSEGFPVECRNGLWHVADSEDGFPWPDLLDEFDVVWPLREVPSGSKGLWFFNGRDMNRKPQWTWDPDPCRDFATPSQSSQDAPKPESPSGGQGSGETPATEALKADSWALADPKTELVKTIREWLSGDAAVELADALLGEGWYPPQADEDQALRDRVSAAQRACAEEIEHATTPEATQLPTKVLALLADPGIVHEVEVDDSGEAGDCIDDCVGCAADRGADSPILDVTEDLFACLSALRATHRDALAEIDRLNDQQKRIDAVIAILDEVPEGQPQGALRRRLRAALRGTADLGEQVENQ